MEVIGEVDSEEFLFSGEAEIAIVVGVARVSQFKENMTPASI